MRAVVISTNDYGIERVVDWRVRGTGQYLWQASSGHLLIHLGRELKEFDAHLNPLRSIHLDGALAWVATSPSANHIVVGTVRERYSAWARKDLEAVTPEDPEEDIQVRLYNEQLQDLLTAVRSSHMPAPVITDTGELRVQRQAPGRWKLLEVDWMRQEHPLADLRSACRPTLTVPKRDMVFVVGCDAVGDRWYRMLRGNGRPILKAVSSSNELEQRAEACAAHTFAIRTVSSVRAFGPNQPFRPSDLTGEHVNVYSDTNGARLGSYVSADFAPSEMNFALSPSGTQLVMVGRSALHFYSVTRTDP